MAEMRLRFDVASLSDIGGRASNQDALGTWKQASTLLLVVSDGAGGHRGGEEAAHTVVDAIGAAFAAARAVDAAALHAYIDAASAAVKHARLQTPDHADMCATVALLALDEAAAQARWAHLGDTRIYLFRDQHLHAVSKDHSLTQQLIDAGYVKPDQQRVHAQRNVLMAAIGAEGDVPPAIGDAIDLQAGDALLVCTDGLWEWVDEAQMQTTLAASDTSAAWLAALCALAAPAAAASGKARDNYSAYAVLVTSA